MTDLEKSPINESKFLGHQHKHDFTEETVESVDEKSKPTDDESAELEKIKESLMQAYEDFISSKSNIDNSIQKKPKTDDEETDDFSFTAKVKDKKDPVTVKSDNAKTFESKLRKVIDNPRFDRLVDYSYPTGTLTEGATSQSIVPYALRIAPLLKPETRDKAFAALDDLHNTGLSVDDIKQVWRLAKIFRNSKKPDIDPVDESTIAATQPITPVAPAPTNNTAQTTQTTQNNTTQNTTTQQPNQQNTNQQQQNNQKPATPPPSNQTIKTSVESMVDLIAKNPSAANTFKNAIKNLPQ